MLRMLLLVVAVLALAPRAVHAEDGGQTDTRAFEYADALSFYGFDGCGDALGGRIYRRALADKFAHCPFAPAARARFAERARAQQVKSSAVLRQMIDEHGGLPVRLEGMTRTCREQMDSPEYQALRGQLDRYQRGEISADAIVPAPCDAASMAP
jgi:hypothetical protein